MRHVRECMHSTFTSTVFSLSVCVCPLVHLRLSGGVYLCVSLSRCDTRFSWYILLLSDRKLKSRLICCSPIGFPRPFGCTATVAFHRCSDTTSLSCGQVPAQALFAVCRHAFSPRTPLSGLGAVVIWAWRDCYGIPGLRSWMHETSSVLKTSCDRLLVVPGD